MELLRAYTEGCPDDLLHDLLGPLRGDLLPLLPELRERLAGLAASPAADPETERVRVLDAVVSVLRRAGEQTPVLVVLDDLQWADELTMLTVRRLLAQDAPRRILLVATLRDTEATQPGLLEDLLADAARHPAWERCDLAGLAVGDVAALAGRDDGGSLAADVHAAVARRPVLRGRAAARPRRGRRRPAPAAARPFREGVLGLLPDRGWRAWPPGARDVLQTAALLGREVELATLLAVTGDRDATLDGVDRGAHARLLHPVPGVPGRLAFTHALVVQALAEDLGASRAMRLHERIALTLLPRRAPPASWPGTSARRPRSATRRTPGAGPAPRVTRRCPGSPSASRPSTTSARAGRMTSSRRPTASRASRSTSPAAAPCASTAIRAPAGSCWPRPARPRPRARRSWPPRRCWP